MADKESLKVLSQGVKIWNKWRKENHNELIDLRGFSLSGDILIGADFSYVDFGHSNFDEVNLSEANLSASFLHGAILNKVDFSKACLADVFFRRSELVDVNFSGADLNDAILQEAEFTRANFTGANLNNTDFSSATLDVSIFVSTDLSNSYGLDSVFHSGPLTIGMDTFALSKGIIPKSFLRGCGLSDWAIESVKLHNPGLINEEVNEILYKIYDLRASQAVQISPLFISYSHADDPFVDMLETQLNKKGIRFWRDVHEMKAGRVEKQIDRAMRLNPTVLLILSKHSIRSDWVEHEVRTARRLEKETGRDVLCPIALDDSWKNSPWPKRLMEQMMEYNILDFSVWQDDSKFKDVFRRLIDGLELFYKG
jgi:uncharacterized protein YjbI with pentapeptide repeats